MKKSLIMFLGLTFSLSSLALTITDKPYKFTGNITTISLTDSGGVINVVGKSVVEAAPLSQIKVISFKEKNEWSLETKYNIGKKKEG